MATDPQPRPNQPESANQAKGNPSANYSLILGILSLPISLVFVFILNNGSGLIKPGIQGGALNVLFCAGAPALSLVGLLAGARGLRSWRTSGQGHTRALAGIVISLAGLLIFAAILVITIISIINYPH